MNLFTFLRRCLSSRARALAGLFILPGLVLTLCGLPALGADLNRLPSQLMQRHWTQENGLPAEVVWALHKSESGFLWLATDNGLARFDGIQFHTYSVATHAAFKSNDIRDVIESRDNTIWAASVGGGLLRVRGNDVTRFDTAHGLNSDATYSLLEASNGDIWVGTTSGACRLRDDQFDCYDSSDGLAGGRIMHVVEDQTGAIWFGSIADGISVFDGTAIKTFGSADGLASPEVVMVVADQELNVMVGTLAGDFYRADRDGLYPLERALLPAGLKPLNALRDRDNNMLIAMFDSLWQFMPEVRRLDNPDDNMSYVLDLADDDDGGLWIASSTGLYQMRAGVFLPVGRAEGLADETYVVAAADDASVWAGTELDGLFHVNDDGVIAQITTADGLPTNAVSALLMASDGTLWAGTFGGGIVLIRDGAIVEQITIETGLLGNQIGSIYEDRSGVVWIGTNAGLSRWSDGEITHNLTTTDGLLADLIRGIQQDLSGRLLLSGDNGITILSTASVTVVDQITSENGLANDAVATTYVDERGVVWIGGRSGGLSRRDGDSLFRFNLGHNVPLVSVMAIVEDAEAELWLGGRDGIVRIPRSDLDAVAEGRSSTVHATTFDASDGLRTTRVSGGYQSAAIQATDGKVWFATTKGLAAVDPTKIVPDPVPPPIRIDAVHADGKQLSVEPQLRIPAGTQSVQVDYSVPSLNHADSLRFRYKMAADSRWQDADDRRSAYFTALSPRKNVFNVQVVYPGHTGSASHGTATKLPLYVEPLWYQTYLARLLAVMFVMMLLWLGLKLALQRSRNQQLQLEKLVGERTVALQEALSKVEKLSRTDMLTGVANRRHFEERIRTQWERATDAGEPIGIMMIDIDHFKLFNDSAGHQAGDLCLISVARALQSSVRQEDFVARIGGEEFAAVLPGSDMSAMCAIAKRLQDNVRALALPHPGLKDGSIVTVSAGFAPTTPQQGDSFEALMRRADDALYRAKEEGRDRVIVAQPDGGDPLTITGAISLAQT